MPEGWKKNITNQADIRGIEMKELMESWRDYTKSLLKEKWLYYNGKMSQEELEERGWDPDPFNGLKVLKGEMDHYYDSDPEIQKSEELIEYWKTTRDTLTDIIDNIKWRHQTIRNMIAWRQFESGS